MGHILPIFRIGFERWQMIRKPVVISPITTHYLQPKFIAPPYESNDRVFLANTLHVYPLVHGAIKR